MRSHRRNRRRLGVALTLVAVVAALVVPSFAAATKWLHVSTAHNATLGKTVLVTTKGRTLYTLSNETHGKLTCKKQCLKSWPPLKLAKGFKPTGAKHLGTIKRPDGFSQVTWNGRPLYTFSGDTKKGDANGEGIKDVGVWHAAAVAVAKAKTPAPAPAMPGYGY
jgi:predicted lipoprotein with Yx(FWY)xxD motif